VPAGTSPAAWQEFTSAEGRFSILFPGKPLQEKEGQADKFTVLTLGGQINYLVSAEQMVKGALDDGPKAVLAQFGGQAGLPNGKIVSRKEITLGQSPGVEWVEEWNDGRARETVARAYVVGDRLYQLAAIYPKDQQAKAETARFFDSFKPR
jgi:hypothetical protein